MSDQLIIHFKRVFTHMWAEFIEQGDEFIFVGIDKF